MEKLKKRLMAKLKHKKIIGFLLLLVLIGAGFGGKVYMDKRKLEKEYQQGIELIQSYVTDYLVKNYAGIKKIEWQGIGVEYRNSPILGPSLFGNYVDTDVKVYVSDDNYFTMTYKLTDETDYDDESQKYVQRKELNPENTNISMSIGKKNGIYSYSEDIDEELLKVSEKEKEEIEKVVQDSSGSPNAETIYNLKIHELKY